MLALLRPSWQGRNSPATASSSSWTIRPACGRPTSQPSRLAEAKRRVGELIDQMKSGDVAMLISFADTARVEQTFTDDRRRLRDGLAAIRPTDRAHVVVGGLEGGLGLGQSGPQRRRRQRRAGGRGPAGDAVHLQRRQIRPVTGFSLGNLKPIFVPIGSPTAANVAIVAFSVGRNEAKPGRPLQAFARLENFGSEKAEVSAELFLDDR